MEAVLIDRMGNDLTVVNAARVSFDVESDWEWDNRESGYGEPRVVLSEKDQKLIKYLAKHEHWTPFSHVQITMRETVPIFIARQRFKHTVGFTYNEISRRYVDSSPDFFVPDVFRSRPDKSIKQGSAGEHPRSAYWRERYIAKLEYDRQFYNDMIADDVCTEQSRMGLPLATDTSYYVTGSLSAWSRAYKLRSDPHSQLEIQTLAKAWNEVISDITELEHSWKALNV
jgi:thymidylate synthase (FAD)